MVRAVVMALCVAIVGGPIVGCARVAIAEEFTEGVTYVDPYVTNQDSVSDELLEQLDLHLQDTYHLVELMYQEQQQERQTQEIEGENILEDEQTNLLREISGNVSTLVDGEGASGGGEVVELRAAGNVTVTPYGNVNPTNQYANYALGMVPKIGWNDEYVYLQDTNQSYIFAWGPLEESDGKIQGVGCHWVRWYWSGQSTGYVVESGDGSVVVNLNSYTVLSSVGDWPVIGDGIDLHRREVMLYALVAVSLYCLRFVWSFLLRMRVSVVAE